MDLKERVLEDILSPCPVPHHPGQERQQVMDVAFEERPHGGHVTTPVLLKELFVGSWGQSGNPIESKGLEA